jgi:DDE superfamily endonuclease
MDPRVMLAITLRFLAGATCLDLAWPYCIALPIVYSVIDETLELLDDSMQNIKFPYTEDDCRAASEGFQRLRNSPFYGVIGAIDGIAVAIRAPSPSECPNPRSFLNRKGFFAINVQAVVGADYSALYLSAKHAGSTHDSTAFQSTTMFNFLSLAAGEIGALPAFAVLSADDAYGNGSCGCRIITPYSGRLTQIGRHVQLLSVVFTGYGGASVWDHCRSLGHIVVTSAMFLEEMQHNSCGVLQGSQFYYPDQGASGGDERAATTCRQ